MATMYRIVVIDGHIIAQFNQCNSGWWTASKASHNNEDDFAIWLYGEATMCKAQALVGACPVIETDLKPVSLKGNGWYLGEGTEWGVDESDKSPKSYYQALRMIARSL